MTWANWAKRFWRRRKQAVAKFNAENAKQRSGQPDQPGQPKRPRFSESLESRQMMSVAGAPINFQPAQFYSLITGTVQVGNFVNGGLPDLVGTDGTENAVHIFLNKGDGTFKAGQDFYVPQARAATVGDFNHDGNEDIAVAAPTNSTDSNSTISTIYIFLGNGDGTFQTPAKQIPVDFTVRDVVAADLNGDGYPDLICTIGRRVLVLINRGNDTFLPPVGYPAGGEFSGELVTGDFNDDGVPDIAVARFQANQVVVLLGQKNIDGTPTGTFGKREIYHVGTNPRALAIGDFNGDGKEDLAVVNSDFRQPSLWVFLGNGDGTFGKPQSYTGGNFVDGVTTGDYNGDGQTDIATVSFTSYLRAYSGNGDGTFQPFKEFSTSSFGQNVVSADFNGDGLDDVATATGGGVRVLLATTSTTPPTNPTSTDVTLGGGNPTSITYQDVSGRSSTISISGPGSVTIDFSGENLSLNGSGTKLIGGKASVASIVGAGTTTTTILSIKPMGPNALSTIGPISTDGSFKAIVAPKVNLLGDLSIPGTVGSLNFDNVSSGIITLASTGPAANITLRNATDETLDSAQPIGTLSVGQWFSSTATPTTITAPGIKTISVTHQFTANLAIGTGGVSSIDAHNISQGTWTVAGAIGTIHSGRDIGFNLTTPSIGSISAKENLNNLVIEAGSRIGSISARAMINSSIYVGVGTLPNGQRLPETASDFTAAGSIGSVSLITQFNTGSFLNSSLAASSLGKLSLGAVVFPNVGQVQGLAANTIGSFIGSDQVTHKSFSLSHPTSLASLTQMNINVADLVLQII